MGEAKLLKRWSGRPDSNRRRPAWEAGILPLNYSRVPLFSSTSLSGKDLAGFPISQYGPRNPPSPMRSDRPDIRTVPAASRQPQTYHNDGQLSTSEASSRFETPGPVCLTRETFPTGKDYEIHPQLVRLLRALRSPQSANSLRFWRQGHA